MKTLEYIKGPCYISGPISSRPVESKNDFSTVEYFLKNTYHELDIVNPRLEKIPEGTKDKEIWGVMMRKSLAQFLQCKSVVFLQGWEHSKGALFEYMLAKHLNMTCLYYYNYDKTIGALEFTSVGIDDLIRDLIVTKCH